MEGFSIYVVSINARKTENNTAIKTPNIYGKPSYTSLFIII